MGVGVCCGGKGKDGAGSVLDCFSAKPSVIWYVKRTLLHFFLANKNHVWMFILMVVLFCFGLLCFVLLCFVLF